METFQGRDLNNADKGQGGVGLLFPLKQRGWGGENERILQSLAFGGEGAAG